MMSKLEKYPKILFFVIALIILPVWVLTPDILIWWFSDWFSTDTSTDISTHLATRGQFGDSFGGVNALFSGLALIGVIIAIILQQKELKNQQNEMKEQKRAMEKETFERTFFHLLEASNEQYNSVEHNHYEEIPSGTPSEQYREDIIQRYRNIGSEDLVIVSNPDVEPDGTEAVNIKTMGKEAFVSAINNNMEPRDSMYLESYFFLVFSALKSADQIEFCENFEEKKFYTDILRSQIPSYAVLALCMYLAPAPPTLDGDERDGETFKKLIETYALFANIRAPIYGRNMFCNIKEVHLGTTVQTLIKFLKKGHIKLNIRPKGRGIFLPPKGVRHGRIATAHQGATPGITPSQMHSKHL